MSDPPARAATPRRLDTREARQEAAQIAALIAPFGARCSKRQGRQLIDLVARLCDALEQTQAELRQASPYRDWYGRLVEDYNGLCAALRDLGIDVGQPGGSADWHWRCGEAGGTAPTIAGAYAAALRALIGREPHAEPGVTSPGYTTAEARALYETMTGEKEPT